MRREPQTASHGALVGVALLCGLVLAVVNVEQPDNLVPPTARPPKRKIAVHDFEWYERAVAVKARATILVRSKLSIIRQRSYLAVTTSSSSRIVGSRYRTSERNAPARTKELEGLQC